MTMARWIPLFAIFFFQIPGMKAQKHDYNWVLGRSVGFGDLLNFNDYALHISPINKTIPFYATNACISDANGNLAFSFNGIKVQNPLHQLMDGTDSFSLGSVPGFYNNSGAATNQGSLTLPIPEENNKFRLFYWDNTSFDISPDTPYFSPQNLYMAIIDMSLNGGEGKIIEKNILVVGDTFANGGINAVKHANGRDWWIVVPKMISNEYHTILISPLGIDTAFVQAAGVWWPPFADIGTQSCFSPNGFKYVRFCDFVGLQICDFDRCSGLFSNSNFIPFEFNEGYFCSASISKDSRYVYVSERTTLWQYDLMASDIASTKTFIAAYDGFENPSKCDFYLAQIAPDGKIYLNTWGGCKNLHIIEHPDRPGTACEFRQHGVSLFTYTEVGLPNMPNFRLGPLDGSNCDSLGIDNIPVAAFRHDLDSMTAEFTDLSWYEPAIWAWDFGDGSTSTERYPTHTYQTTGQHQVCLTVSNQYGTDTYCRMVLPGASGTSEKHLEHIALFPNPSTDQLKISLPDGWYGPIHIMLTNISGQVIHSENLNSTNDMLSLALGSLSNGLYVCRVAASDKTPLSAVFEVMR